MSICCVLELDPLAAGAGAGALDEEGALLDPSNMAGVIRGRFCWVGEELEVAL